jgi:intracellular multiplication protein IcmP
MAEHKSPDGGRTVTMGDPVMWLAIVAGLYLLGWLIWYKGHSVISLAYAHYRLVLALPGYVLGYLGIPGFGGVYQWVETYCQPSAWMLCQRDFSNAQWSEIMESSVWFNLAMLVPLIGMSVMMFLRLNATHPKVNFSRRHSVQSFAKSQKPLYPHLSTFINLFDVFIEAPLDHPLYGMGKTTKQVCFENGLIAGWFREEGGGFSPVINQEKAGQYLLGQMGSPWRGTLTASELMVASIVLPRVAATDSTLSDQDFKAAMDESERMIKFCWAQFVPSKEVNHDDQEWMHPDIDYSIPREVVSRYMRRPHVSSVFERHAYTRTGLFRAISEARRVGVLPPCDMRWLRFFDRTLWYAVQSIGRQAPYAEAAGLFAHFLYELREDAPLIKPQLQKGVDGLRDGVCSYRFSEAEVRRYYKINPDLATDVHGNDIAELMIRNAPLAPLPTGSASDAKKNVSIARG